MSPTVDVVIATFNRQEGLARCLDGLALQHYRDFRVILVDDCGATPASEVVEARKYPFEIDLLRTRRNSGPAVARNMASHASGADYLAFLDDDVVPGPQLLDRHLKGIQSGLVGTVSIGPLLAPPDWRPTPWNRWESETVARQYRCMREGVYKPSWRQFFTGNALLARADFVEAGGFNESFTRAEDIEFAYRLARRGCAFVFEPAAVAWHYAHRSLGSWRAIPGQYAHFDLEIDRLHPELEWLECIRDEGRRRHAGTRVASAALRAVALEQAGASTAIAAARLLAGLRVWRASSPLLSLAFNLEYNRTSRELTRRPTFHGVSTTPP